MTEGVVSARKSAERMAFEIYLRTGKHISARQIAVEIECKFNPWHDPDDGRFTFAGRGRYTARGSGSDRPSNGGTTARLSAGKPQRSLSSSTRTAASTQPNGTTSRFDPRHPSNHAAYIVQQGDTLTSLAARRRGLRASDLAMLNDLPGENRLKTGQRLIIPTQAYLNAGKAARANFVNLAFYMDTHGGKLPPNAAKTPSVQEQLDSNFTRKIANGYNYDIDIIQRTREIHGDLQSGNPEKRSRSLQRQAGGPDRLPTDDGGHYIAARFGGPREAFNHFAQDASFNRGRYLALENKWDRAKKTGQRVHIDIVPSYHGTSQRPYKIVVKSTINGETTRDIFKNEPKEY